MNVFTELRKEVGHGGVVPAGYQMAWYEPRRRMGVYYPAPLHWILRLLRELSHRLQIAMQAPEIECDEVFQMQRAQRERERLAQEYARGYLVGWRECFQTCLQAVEEEIERADDMWNIRALLPGDPETSQKN